MPPAIIAAGIGAVAGVGGAIISSNGAKSAANTAATTAASNNALQSQIYQQNTANEQPFMQRGNAAGQQINDLLGLGQGTPGTPGTAGQFDANAYLSQNPDVATAYANDPGISKSLFPTAQSYAQWHYNNYGQNEGRSDPLTGGTPGTPGVSGADSAMNAFNNFQKSDGYQFRLGQGLNAVNTNFALRGGLGSGAAAKELNNYAQGQASNEFGNYIGTLQNQQGVGLSAANALNGVGTNYANAVSSNNNNAAGAAGSAAIQSGNAFSGALNGLGTAASLALGTGSIYTPGNALTSSAQSTIAANPGIF